MAQILPRHTFTPDRRGSHLHSREHHGQHHVRPISDIVPRIHGNCACRRRRRHGPEHDAYRWLRCSRIYMVQPIRSGKEYRHARQRVKGVGHSFPPDPLNRLAAFAHSALMASRHRSPMAPMPNATGAMIRCAGSPYRCSIHHVAEPVSTTAVSTSRSNKSADAAAPDALLADRAHRDPASDASTITAYSPASGPQIATASARIPADEADAGSLIISSRCARPRTNSLRHTPPSMCRLPSR